MDGFKTILEKNVTAELVEKKSKFIANIFYVESVNEAEEKIKNVKKQYYDAKHNCFAYIISENNVLTKRFSDDGEPNGTAGAPMLDILEKQKLYNVVVIITRYFGGILLGTGGLVRAYSETLKKAIKNAQIIEQESGYEVEVELEYSNLEQFKYYCNKKNIKIIKSEYANNVICRIDINDEEKKLIMNEINKQNTLRLIRFDIIRQKNIANLSKPVN